MTPEQFRAHRLALGLTQQQLADLMGYSRQSTISAIEKRGPTEVAARLLEMLVKSADTRKKEQQNDL